MEQRRGIETSSFFRVNRTRGVDLVIIITTQIRFEYQYAYDTFRDAFLTLHVF